MAFLVDNEENLVMNDNFNGRYFNCLNTKTHSLIHSYTNTIAY